MFESARVYLNASLPWTGMLMGSGQAGVTIFFALSGFLITVRYFDDLGAKRIGFGRYWLKRFARIYPVFAFTLTFLMVIPRLLEGDATYHAPITLLALYTLMQGLTMQWFALGIPTGWTLTVEEIYYVAAPALMVLSGGGRQRAQLASPVAITLRGIALSLVCVAIVLLTLAVPALAAPSGFNTEFLIGAGFFARLPEFIAGMVAGHFFLKYRDAGTKRAGANSIAALACVACVVTLIGSNLAFEARNFALYALLRFAGSVGASGMILGFALGADNGLARWLGSPVMDYLGKSSYALYLVHLTWPLQKLWSALNLLPIHPIALIPLNYVAAVLASIILYELIEQPAHRFLSEKLDGKR